MFPSQRRKGESDGNASESSDRQIDGSKGRKRGLPAPAADVGNQATAWGGPATVEGKNSQRSGRARAPLIQRGSLLPLTQ